MNDVIINKVAYGCTEGKEAATYFHLCLNMQLLKPITVLYPCLPLLFHTSSRLCSSMALSQGSGHFSFWLDPHNLVITTKRLVLLMLQHHFHLLNMIHFVLTSPGGGHVKASPSPSVQRNLLYLEVSVMCHVSARILGSPLFHLFSESHFALVHEGKPRLGRGKIDTLTSKSSPP